MNFKTEKKDPFNVIGAQLHVAEPTEAETLIGQFWEQFRSNKTKDTIPDRLHPEETIAVYTNYGKQGSGYSLILGAQVKHLVNNVPHDMVGITIPEQTYAVFSCTGAMPQTLQTTWQQIWQAPIKRAYTYDFEVYKNDSLDSTDIDVYIALKPGYRQAA